MKASKHKLLKSLTKLLLLKNNLLNQPFWTKIVRNLIKIPDIWSKIIKSTNDPLT